MPSVAEPSGPRASKALGPAKRRVGGPAASADGLACGLALVEEDGAPPASQRSRSASRPRTQRYYEVPCDGPCSLIPGEDGRLQIDAGPPASPDRLAELETIHVDRQAYLVVHPRGAALAVNGAPAPRVAVVRPGDEIRLGPERRMLVSLRSRPYLGPAAAEHAGLKCVFCRTPVRERAPIFVCARCRAPMHCEDDDRPADERLQCAAAVTRCPRCDTPVVLSREEQFSHVW